GRRGPRPARPHLRARKATMHDDFDPAASAERVRRWRLVLGNKAEDACAASLGGGPGTVLTGDDARMDAALAALYNRSDEGVEDLGGRRGAGLGASAPRVARWLGDIRDYFPASVVRVMQQDALHRLNLRQLLLEPEMMEAVEPDVHLVGTLL